MRRRLLVVVVVMIFLMGTGCKNNTEEISKENPKKAEKYGVFVGADASEIDKISEYDVAVIDAEYFSERDIEKIKKSGTRLYTYLNIGSLEEFRSYYENYKDLSLGVYENWEDEIWINVADDRWQKLCVEKAEEYKKKSIDGFFIDNCSVYYVYPTQEIYQGIKEILGQLSKIDEDIIINGGDPFVEKYLEEADSPRIFKGVNQESVYTTIDFSTGEIRLAEEESKEYFTIFLNEVKEKGYDVYVLEYVSNEENREKALNYARENGWTIYISESISLQ